MSSANADEANLIGLPEGRSQYITPYIHQGVKEVTSIFYLRRTGRTTHNSFHVWLIASIYSPGCVFAPHISDGRIKRGVLFSIFCSVFDKYSSF